MPTDYMEKILRQRMDLYSRITAKIDFNNMRVDYSQPIDILLSDFHAGKIEAEKERELSFEF